jgi:hypothetical protein
MTEYGGKLRIVDRLDVPESVSVDLRFSGVWLVEPAE